MPWVSVAFFAFIRCSSAAKMYPLMKQLPSPFTLLYLPYVPLISASFRLKTCSAYECHFFSTMHKDWSAACTIEEAPQSVSS